MHFFKKYIFKTKLEKIRIKNVFFSHNSEKYTVI